MAIIENFDGLTNGDLNGQNGWSGSTYYDVQSTVYKAGSKAAFFDAPDNSTYYSIEKTITGQDETVFTFYARVESQNYYTSIELKEGDTRIFRVQFDGGSKDLDFLSGGASIELNGNYSVSTWYKCDIEIRSSDGYGRARLDDGTWTDWRAPYTTYTSINKIYMHSKGDDFYIDEISDTSDITLAVATMALVLNYGNITLTKISKIVVDTMNLTVNFADVFFGDMITLVVDTMNLSLNFADATLTKISKLIVNTMNLAVDFKDVILKKIGWTNETKPTSSWTNEDK